MNPLEILLELVTIEEQHAAKLRSLYAKAANTQAQPIPHHVGGDALVAERREQNGKQKKANYPPVRENCECGEPVNRRSGTSPTSGDPYVMSHCAKPKSSPQNCGYRKFYDPLPQEQAEPEYDWMK